MTQLHELRVFPNKVSNGTIVGSFGFGIEITGGQLMICAVVGDALATDAFFGAIIRTGTSLLIFILIGTMGHGILLWDYNALISWIPRISF
jgi:hypothetical protein